MQKDAKNYKLKSNNLSKKGRALERNRAPIISTNNIRKVVQYCFDQAAKNLNKYGFSEAAGAINAATVHWLRHTGISDDVKFRPREHVRDNAGYSSSAITDKYIDI